MGETLSNLKDEAGYGRFSAALGRFSAQVGSCLPADGELIYAGGDDVLAVVRATDAVRTARRLREAFGRILGADGFACTASAGIAVAHVSAPFQDTVEAAHGAEHEAKQAYGRDAVALRLAKRSGEEVRWGCKWGSPALRLYEELADLASVRGDLNVARVPYKLAAMLQPYGLGRFRPEPGLADVMLQDTLTVLGRTRGTEVFAEHFTADLKAYLKEVTEAGRPEDYLTLFMVESFIDRPREEA